MNKKVEYYISELLFLHDCVILPKFGGFVGNPQSAKLNKITGSLTPPSKQILFNTNLKTNDGLLITHVSNQESISQILANKEVSNYITEIKEKLTESKVLRIDKIGLFTLGREGNVLFLQDSSSNYSLDSFGLKSTYNKKVIREISDINDIVSSIKKVKKYSDTKVLLRVAAVIIPLIAISYFSISQKENINNIYLQMASLSPLTTIIKTETINKLEKEIIIPTEVIKERILPESDIQKIVPQIISETKYFIIGGAFSERKNANRMLEKLNKWHYNASIVKGGSLLRVSYNTFYNKDEALLALRGIKQENSEAWLLTK